MYRPDEMAALLEQMRNEIKKQQLGRKEKKVITWDGHGGSENSSFYKVSDEPIDWKQCDIVGLTAVSPYFPGNMVSLSGRDLEIENISDGVNAIIPEGAQGDWMVIFVDRDIEYDNFFTSGVWFMYGHSEGIYISRLELETIHPIPAEYIPPLDRLILNGADGNQYALTITDGAISVAPVTT